MPAAVWKKRRRLMPWRLASASPSSMTRASTCSVGRLGQRRELVARDELGRDGRGEARRSRRARALRGLPDRAGSSRCPPVPRVAKSGLIVVQGARACQTAIPVGYTPRHGRAWLHRLRHDRAGRLRPRRRAGHHPGRAADLVPRAPAASGRPGGRAWPRSGSARASGSVSSPRTMPPTWTSTAPARARASSPTRSTGDSPARKWSECWSAPRPR